GARRPLPASGGAAASPPPDSNRAGAGARSEVLTTGPVAMRPGPSRRSARPTRRGAPQRGGELPLHARIRGGVARAATRAGPAAGAGAHDRERRAAAEARRPVGPETLVAADTQRSLLRSAATGVLGSADTASPVPRLTAASAAVERSSTGGGAARPPPGGP